MIRILNIVAVLRRNIAAGFQRIAANCVTEVAHPQDFEVLGKFLHYYSNKLRYYYELFKPIYNADKGAIVAPTTVTIGLHFAVAIIEGEKPATTNGCGNLFHGCSANTIAHVEKNEPASTQGKVVAVQGESLIMRIEEKPFKVVCVTLSHSSFESLTDDNSLDILDVNNRFGCPNHIRTICNDRIIGHDNKIAQDHEL
ncbi:hypothetical protein ACH5RR_041354 [Cinchona calisaya]|uniref:Uncharacterized protein n=1 Tax=Cinchona calisaya TaxID=153742 RepID=A0ABD2XWF7_9GENT